MTEENQDQEEQAEEWQTVEQLSGQAALEIEPLSGAAALEICAVSVGSAAKAEFTRRANMNGKEILFLGYSYQPNIAGWHDVPREFRLSTFIGSRRVTDVAV
jgi:hypothetical protein